MTRALLFALLLVAAPAWAQQVPDPLSKGNANVMGAGGSINLSASTVKPAFMQTPGSMSLTGGGWSINNWFGGGFGGQGAQWLFGSKDNPITAGGSPVAIGVVQAIPKENCANQSAATGCNSALLLQNMGTAASTMVSSALTAYAETQSTVGGGFGNAQGINALGVGSATSTAHGMGAYINGVRLGTLGGLRGMELRATNASAADCDPAAQDLTSQCMGLSLALVGPPAGPRRLISAAIQVSAISTLFGGAREGLIFGHNSVTETTIADRTNSTTSIIVGGTHDIALQTYSAGAGRVLLGTPASYAGPGGFERAMQIYSGGVQLGDFGGDVNSPQFTFTKSRGATVGSHTAVAAGDHLGQIVFSGSDGTSFPVATGMILATVEGAVSAGVVPTKLAFWTTDSSGVGTEVLKITSAGSVQVSGDVVAAGLATSGTIAGSLCRTSTGTFIYKAGANCF